MSLHFLKTLLAPFLFVTQRCYLHIYIQELLTCQVQCIDHAYIHYLNQLHFIKKQNKTESINFTVPYSIINFLAPKNLKTKFPFFFCFARSIIVFAHLQFQALSSKTKTTENKLQGKKESAQNPFQRLTR